MCVYCSEEEEELDDEEIEKRRLLLRDKARRKALEEVRKIYIPPHSPFFIPVPSFLPSFITLHTRARAGGHVIYVCLYICM